MSFVFPRPQFFPRLRLGPRKHWGSRGNKTYCFTLGPVIKYLLVPLRSSFQNFRRTSTIIFLKLESFSERPSLKERGPAGAHAMSFWVMGSLPWKDMSLPFVAIPLLHFRVAIKGPLALLSTAPTPKYITFQNKLAITIFGSIWVNTSLFYNK